MIEVKARLNESQVIQSMNKMTEKAKKVQAAAAGGSSKMDAELKKLLSTVKNVSKGLDTIDSKTINPETSLRISATYEKMMDSLIGMGQAIERVNSSAAKGGRVSDAWQGKVRELAEQFQQLFSKVQAGVDAHQKAKAKVSAESTQQIEKEISETQRLRMMRKASLESEMVLRKKLANMKNEFSRLVVEGMTGETSPDHMKQRMETYAKLIGDMRSEMTARASKAAGSVDWIDDRSMMKLDKMLTDFETRVQTSIAKTGTAAQRAMDHSIAAAQQSLVKARNMFLTGLTMGFAIVQPFRIIVKEAGEAEKALNSLGREARANAVSGDKAIESARNMEIVKNGVVSLSAAARAMKLAFRIGFDAEEAKKVVNQMTEIAIENKQSALTLDEALVNAFEGFKQELSQLADAAGVTKNISVIYKEYAAQLGKSFLELTKKEKKEAIAIELNREHAKSAGALADSYKTLSGASDRLTGSWKILLQDLGLKLRESFLSVYSATTNLVNGIDAMVRSTPTWLANLAAMTTATTVFLGAIGLLMGSIAALTVMFGHFTTSLVLLGTSMTATLAIATKFASVFGIVSTSTLTTAGAFVLGIKVLSALALVIGTVVAASYGLKKAMDAANPDYKSYTDLKKNLTDIRAEYTEQQEVLKRLGELARRYNAENSKTDKNQYVVSSIKAQMMELVKLADVSEVTRMKMTHLINQQIIDEKRLTGVVDTETKIRQEARDREFKASLENTRKSLEERLRVEARRDFDSSSGRSSIFNKLNPANWGGTAKAREEDTRRFTGNSDYKMGHRLSLVPEEISYEKVVKTPIDRFMSNKETLMKIHSDSVEEVKAAREAFSRMLRNDELLMKDDNNLKEVLSFWINNMKEYDAVNKELNEVMKLQGQSTSEVLKKPEDAQSIDKLLQPISKLAGNQFASKERIEKLLRGDGKKEGVLDAVAKSISLKYREGLEGNKAALENADKEAKKVIDAFKMMSELILTHGNDFDLASEEVEKSMEILENSIEASSLTEFLKQLSTVGTKQSKSSGIGVDPLSELISASLSKTFNPDLIQKTMGEIQVKYEALGLSTQKLENTVESENKILSELYDKMWDAHKSKNRGEAAKLKSAFEMVDNFYKLSDALLKVKTVSAMTFAEEKKVFEQIRDDASVSAMDKVEVFEELLGSINNQLAEAGEFKNQEQKQLLAMLKSAIDTNKKIHKDLMSDAQIATVSEFQKKFEEIKRSTMSMVEKVEALKELKEQLDIRMSEEGSTRESRTLMKTIGYMMRDFEEEVKQANIDQANQHAESARQKLENLLATETRIKQLREGIARIRSELSTSLADEGLSTTRETRSIDKAMVSMDKKLSIDIEAAENYLKTLERQVSAKEKELSVGAANRTELENSRLKYETLRELYTQDLEQYALTAEQKLYIEEATNEKVIQLTQDVANARQRQYENMVTATRDIFVTEFNALAMEGRKLSDVLFNIFKNIVNEMQKIQVQNIMKSKFVDSLIGGIAGGLQQSMNSSPAASPASNIGQMGQQWYENVTNNYSISAMDSASFEQYVNQNKDVIVGVTSRENRKYDLRGTER